MAKNLSIVANGISGDEGHLLGYNVSDNGIYTPSIGDVVRGTTATYVAQDGTIKTAQPNVARVDYTNGVAELLLEPASTNLIQNSEPTSAEGASGGITYESFNWANGFTNCVRFEDNLTTRFWYGGNNTYLFKQSKYPNAYKIGFLANSLDTRDFLSQTNVSITNGTTYCFSAEVEVVTEVSAINNMINIIGGSGLSFRLNGVDVPSSENVPKGNHIVECYFTPSTSTDVTLRVGVGVNTDSNGKVYFDLVQFETSPYRTSWIPNNSSSIVTRSADSITNFGSSQIIDSQSGILLFEGSCFANSSNIISLSNTANNNNKVIVKFDGTDISLGVRASSTSRYKTQSYENGNNVKGCVKWSGTSFESFVNGVSIGTDVLNSAIPQDEFNTLRFTYTSTSSPFYGRVRQVKHLPYNTDISKL